MPRNKCYKINLKLIRFLSFICDDPGISPCFLAVFANVFSLHVSKQNQDLAVVDARFSSNDELCSAALATDTFILFVVLYQPLSLLPTRSEFKFPFFQASVIP